LRYTDYDWSLNDKSR